ncbi:uncharacterized protein BDV14DRAFT_28450 [Aspergillus stella-maris]|uniref:uncharacterized protein n=1 Tax=Aspergillus stella-maris TaxID=1810926 RepID=UPI003CCCD854
MLATQMPPPASHLPFSKPDTSDKLSVMSPALPSQNPHPAASHSHSSMACGLSSNAPSRTPALSRPKLTLQTSSLPMTFGSSTTGLSLSLAAGSTASPTVRNTFKNAYEVAYPSSATASPSRSSNSRFSKPASPYASSNPYQQPLGVKSILRNSCLDSNKRRPSIVAANGPNGSSSRRVYFPTKKQVSYRNPLEEEITTVKYTARHSDIVSDEETGSCETSSDEESDYSTTSLVSSDTTPSDDDERSTSEPTGDKKKKKRKYRSNERQVRAIARMEGLEDPYTRTPQTPRQGRLKRRREWRWTLGPLNEIGSASTTDSPASQLSASTSTSTPSESEPNPSGPDTPASTPAKPSQIQRPPALSLAMPVPRDMSESNTDTNTAISLEPQRQTQSDLDYGYDHHPPL